MGEIGPIRRVIEVLPIEVPPSGPKEEPAEAPRLDPEPASSPTEPVPA